MTGESQEAALLAAQAYSQSGGRGFFLPGAHPDANGVDSTDVRQLSESVFLEVQEAWSVLGGRTTVWQIGSFQAGQHTGPDATQLILTNGSGSLSAEVAALDHRAEASGLLTHAFHSLPDTDPLPTRVNGDVSGNEFAALSSQGNAQFQRLQAAQGTFVGLFLNEPSLTNTQLRTDFGNLLGTEMNSAHNFVYLHLGAGVLDEDDQRLNGKLVRMGDELSQSLAVSFEVSDESELATPFPITFAADEAETAVVIQSKDDNLLDGSQTVQVIPVVANYLIGQSEVVVRDIETLTLSLSQSELSEFGGQIDATVTRSNVEDLGAAQTLSLMIDDESELAVPAGTVSIPAGAASTTFALDAVDDRLLDGAQTVQLTVSADGFVGATQAITVSDYEPLTISLDSSDLRENGPSVSGRVTRGDQDDLSESVAIQIASSDSSAATVAPGSVVIPAGQQSVEFVVEPTDDQFLDGTQTTTLSASAVGFVDAALAVDVRDDETPQLELVISATGISESGGATSAVVTRNTSTDSPLIVVLGSSDPSEATVPDSVTIPAGKSSVEFPVNAVDDPLVDGPQQVSVTASAVDHESGSDTIVIADDDVAAVTVQFSSGFAREDSGPIDVMVHRNTGTDFGLVVQLVSSDVSELSVPATVTIPAGQRTVSFMATPVSDGIVDGDQNVRIEANAPFHASGNDSLSVVDVDEAELSFQLSVPSIAEDAGQLTALVSRNTATLSSLTVLLSVQPASAVTVDGTVEIPAGQSSIQVPIQLIDDEIVEGDRAVTFIASASGHTSSDLATLMVLEDDQWSWTNAVNHLDVNDDGFTSPIDALLIVNYLNQSSSSTLPPLTEKPPAFLDTSNDGFASPIDALIVINFLNSGGRGEGEPSPDPDQPVDEVIDLLVDELERRRKKASDQFFQDWP